MLEQKRDIDRIRWCRCLNNSSSNTIPAFGAMKVVSSDKGGVLTVDQPDTDNQDVVINGPVPILPQTFGICTRDPGPVCIAYDTAATPDLGDDWGAAADSYFLKKDNTGFVAYGGPANGRAIFYRAVPVGEDWGVSIGAAWNISGQAINATTTAITLQDPTNGLLMSGAYDPKSFWNSDNPTRLTVPTGGAGKYSIKGDIAFTATVGSSSPAGQFFEVNVQDSAGAISFAQLRRMIAFESPSGSYTLWDAVSFTFEADLNVGQYITIPIRIYSNGAGTSGTLLPSNVVMRKVDKGG
jgi:hypothetical protein